MNLPEKNELYGTREYWDSRYEKETGDEAFDWFQSYDTLRDIFRDLVQHSQRLLMLGCGNSRLSEDMWADDYRDIVNVDVGRSFARVSASVLKETQFIYSSVVIDTMKQRHADKTMEWLEMDVRDLKFPDASFDVVVDKGTMDSMITEKHSVWNPPARVIEDCNKEVDEVIRVLRPNGIFIYITFGQPHFRRRYLTRPGWSLEVRELGDTFHYYCYIMRRNVGQ